MGFLIQLAQGCLETHHSAQVGGSGYINEEGGCGWLPRPDQGPALECFVSLSLSFLSLNYTMLSLTPRPLPAPFLVLPPPGCCIFTPRPLPRV